MSSSRWKEGGRGSDDEPRVCEIEIVLFLFITCRVRGANLVRKNLAIGCKAKVEPCGRTVRVENRGFPSLLLDTEGLSRFVRVVCATSGANRSFGMDRDVIERF